MRRAAERGRDPRGAAPDTVERIFRELGAPTLAHRAGAYLALRERRGPVTFPAAGPGWLPAVAVDGKAVRGAAGPDGKIPFLLAAATHGSGIVLAGRLIGDKANEIPEFGPLLRELDSCYPLAGQVITADAARTVKAHARLICGELLAHYVLTVKLSTRKLYEELDALDWAQVPRLVREERGHGRWERRTIQVMDAPAHVKKAVPARPPGRSRRAVRHPHHPHEDGKALGPPGGEVRGRGAHHHQPQRAGGVPASPGRLCPRPLDDREQGPLGP